MKLFNYKEIFKNIGDSLYYQLLECELRNCKTVLDLGCGKDSPLGKIRKTFKSEGVDIDKKSILESKKRSIHDSYKIADIRKLDKIYNDGSFDAVVALDIIEHLERKEGERLLKTMEKTARKKVIVLTPNGFLPQTQDLLEDNPHQVHKSGWIKKDLEREGYKVYGLRGLKCLRGQHAEIKYKPYFFWGFISFLSERLFYFIPSLSFDLFAVKRVEEL